MADSDTSFRLEIAGADQVAAGFDKVSQAVSKNTAEQQKAAVATEALGAQHAQGVPKVQQFAGVLTQSGAALAKLNPEMGEAVMKAGQLTSTIGQLSQGGFSPFAIAVTAATGALSLVADEMAKAEVRAGRLGEAMDLSTQNVRALTAALVDQRRQQADIQRLAAGGGTELDYQAQLNDLLRRRREIIEQMNSDRTGFGGVLAGVGLGPDVQRQGENDLAQLRAEIQRVTALRDRAGGDRSGTLIEESGGIVDPNSPEGQAILRSRGGARGSRRGGGGRRSEEDTGDVLGEKTKFGGSPAEDLGKPEDTGVAAKAALTAQADAEREVHEHRAEMHREQLRWEDERHRAALSHLQAEQAQWAQVGDVSKNVISTTTDLLAAGAKTQAEGDKIRAYGQGINELIAAAVDEAAAISNFASGNVFTGAMKEVAVGLHIAAAAKAFAFSGGGGASGGGGGGGGSGGGGGAVRPSASDRGPSGGGGGLTIQILGPMIAAGDKSAAGRLLTDTIRSAARTYGTRSDGLPA